MKYFCDVIILTFNQLGKTRACMESFFRCTKSPCRLIVIDNASTDGTVDYLKALEGRSHRESIFIYNSENVGYVEGVNQGLAYAKSNYVCLANNDLIFTSGWLEEIFKAFENNLEFGLLNPNSNNLGLAPRSLQEIDSFADQLGNKHSGVAIEMPFCIGFCMVIKKEVIEKIGFLSKEFAPAFFEDSDYSLRVRKAGYKIGMAKASYVWHSQHASFDQMQKAQTEAMFSKSRETFIRKWGKAVRIAWVADSQKDVEEFLSCSTEIAREGNFLTFYVKNTKIDRHGLFQKKHMHEHSGVYFNHFKNALSLFFRFIFKKKKFDLIIFKKNRLSLIFKTFMPCLFIEEFNSCVEAQIQSRIQQIKFKK